MSESLINVSYLGAAILFILALGGLKNNQSARRGNYYGMIGMTIAVLVTIFAFVSKNHNILIAVMVVGGVGGLLKRGVSVARGVDAGGVGLVQGALQGRVESLVGSPIRESR